MVGARVIKTSFAVAISILIAKSLHLYAFQFAGIIAVLSVQPSLYRSLRNGMQHTASAVIGAVLGAAGLFAIGDSFLAMALIAFLLMAFHVQIKWTNSLLVSVVIAINTMGTLGLEFWEAAWNQIALVLIGTGTGTLINLIHKPVHQERAEELLGQSEGMLRALLHFIALHLQRGQISSYSALKEQIDEIRVYLKRGKEVSGFVVEDRRFRKRPVKDTANMFSSFEMMLERIHDMSKALSDVNLNDDEIAFSKKTLRLLAKTQENMMDGKRVNLRLFERVMEHRRNQLLQLPGDTEMLAGKLGFYSFYGYVAEYLKELGMFLVEKSGQVKKRLTYTSIDRPGLLAEVSDILVKHGLNITDVSIRVKGDFAATEIEVSVPVGLGGESIVEEIRKVRNVLKVELK